MRVFNRFVKDPTFICWATILWINLFPHLLTIIS